jgi:hypothetical protein
MSLLLCLWLVVLVAVVRLMLVVLEVRALRLLIECIVAVLLKKINIGIYYD